MVPRTKTGEEGHVIEKKIVEDIASYGRQIGWIMEVLNMVVEKLDKNQELNNLTGKQNKSLEDFRKLIRSVEDVKKVGFGSI